MFIRCHEYSASCGTPVSSCEQTVDSCMPVAQVASVSPVTFYTLPEGRRARVAWHSSGTAANSSANRRLLAAASVPRPARNTIYLGDPAFLTISEHELLTWLDVP